MIYSGYELAAMFFIYSFFGWILEVMYTALGKKRLINRGFLNGIICPIYGFSMVFMIIFLDSLKGQLFYLFLGCMIIGSVIELMTGLLLEKIFHTRLWDYSNRKFHVNGYICATISIAWGVLGTLIIKVINPLLLMLGDKIPVVIGNIFLIIFTILMMLDAITTVAVLMKGKKQSHKIQEIAESFTQTSYSLRAFLIKWVNRRMEKAFPNQEKSKAEQLEEEKEHLLRKTIFGYGCGFYKIVWIFLLGSFLGDITETIFCRITVGRWMSRSSVVYGPFSLVWGIGVAGLSILLYKYRNKEDRYIFISGTLLGGAYEYICSVFTELAFGTVFWDYSGLPFNLGGRINLLYCFFWGFASLLWIKLIYPIFSKWIEKIPIKPGKVLTYVMIVFMIGNVLLSGTALSRYSERAVKDEPNNQLEVWVDQEFNDERMDQIYPNAKMR